MTAFVRGFVEAMPLPKNDGCDQTLQRVAGPLRSLLGRPDPGARFLRRELHDLPLDELRVLFARKRCQNKDVLYRPLRSGCSWLIGECAGEGSFPEGWRKASPASP